MRQVLLRWGGMVRLWAGLGMFRLRARYFPVMESTQRSPGLRPRTPGEPFRRKTWRKIDRRGWRLVVVLLSPPAAALLPSVLVFIIPCLGARLVWQQSRGAAVNSLPLGEGGSAVAETDEGNAKGFYLSYVETAHLSIAFPSSAPSGHLPPGEGWGYRLPSPGGKSKKGAAAPFFVVLRGEGS